MSARRFPPTIERIKSRTTFTEDGCWLYHPKHGNYAQIEHEGKSKLVHRVSYELHVGTIPEGLSVLHKCVHGNCWNPEHLYTGILSPRTGRPRQTVIGRLERQTTKIESGCWLFNGVKTKNGYGRIRINRRFEPVHRAAWEIFRGPIPERMLVLHKCIGQRNCWNPEHLYIGTNADNSRDMIEQNRLPPQYGEFNPRSKLTNAEVLEIRGNTDGWTYAQIGEMYGITRSAVGHIRRRTLWTHL